MLEVKRADRYGFCSGVRVAVTRLRQLASSNRPAAILGQVVHNERVVQEMEEAGLCTVRSLDELDEAAGATIVFSAHGVPPSYHEQARSRGLTVLDTTCKFVYEIHHESQRALADGCHLVFIGDPQHREVIGYTHDLDHERYHVISNTAQARTVDWAVYPAIRIFFQTTLNADDYEEIVCCIEHRNPRTVRTDTICYATKENQEAARRLARDKDVDLVLVIGGARSANTRHLLEITSRNKPSYLIQGASDIDPAWLQGVRCVGLTAGASTPDATVDEVEQHLRSVKWRGRNRAEE